MTQESIAASHWDNRYQDKITLTWLANKIVMSEINTRIAGRDVYWMSWLFAEYFGGSVGRVLSIGCGDGAHELAMARNNWASKIDAFDISERGIKKASETAASERLSVNFYCDEFESFIGSKSVLQYDTVMFLGSLHHVKNLDEMLHKVGKILKPEGALVINEYCGPCFNIYDQARIDIINGILNSLDAEFKMRPDAQWVNPSYQLVQQIDPSEAIRSALIPSFLRYFFEPEVERHFGGSILHPIFDHLNSSRMNDGSAESNSIIRTLIHMENVLLASRVLPHDFVLGVYRHKK